MFSILEMVEQIDSRLPELEYRLDEIGKIQCRLLPKGLFRVGQYEEWVSSVVCIDEVRTDLKRLRIVFDAAKTAQDDEQAMLFLAKKISLKMQVLLHLCHSHYRKKTSRPHHMQMKQLVTRQQWLENLTRERDRLLLQQSSLQRALDNNKDVPHAVKTLQHALSDIDDQLSSLEQTLATLGSLKA